MTESQFNARMRKLRKRNKTIEYKQELMAELLRLLPRIKIPSTSKIVLGVSALLCLETLMFCQYMIILTGDMNALYAMVGALFTFMGTVISYYAKSIRENTEGGVVYLNAMADLSKHEMQESADAMG